MSELVTRSKRQSYMNTGTAAEPVWNLIGEGFTNLAESKNPTEYSRQYVHESTKRTDITGFAPSVAYSADIYTENPVIETIVEITDKELVGTDAQRDVVNVNLFEPVVNSSSEFVAYKRTYSVIPNTLGDGTDALIYTGNMKAVGDSVKGKFNTSTKTFTADT